MNETQSEFNSGISYLQTMRSLMNSYHAAIILKNFQEAGEYLISLFLELEPRMNEDLVKKVESPYKNVLYLIDINKTNTLEYRKELSILFRYLNKFAHSDGLIMNDKDNARDALQNGR